jgi:hypothetical protein
MRRFRAAKAFGAGAILFLFLPLTQSTTSENAHELWKGENWLGVRDGIRNWLLTAV